jgi:hypothetical protein
MSRPLDPSNLSALKADRSSQTIYSGPPGLAPPQLRYQPKKSHARYQPRTATFANWFTEFTEKQLLYQAGGGLGPAKRYT